MGKVDGFPRHSHIIYNHAHVQYLYEAGKTIHIDLSQYCIQLVPPTASPPSNLSLLNRSVLWFSCPSSSSSAPFSAAPFSEAPSRRDGRGEWERCLRLSSFSPSPLLSRSFSLCSLSPLSSLWCLLCTKKCQCKQLNFRHL